MTLFGLTITRREKAAPSAVTTVNHSRGWWPLIREPFTGAWQRNMELTVENVLAHSAVYACITLISSDIAKLRIKLVRKDAHGIWHEVDNPAWSPVLRKPNHYQTRIQFLQTWVTSKLTFGNTYVLKQRDNRGVVVALYVLDPQRVQVLVAPDGSVFYALDRDDLSGLEDPKQGTEAVPASEIIHDVMNPLYHPLCGVSPISACGLAALQGLRIQHHSSRFFGNGARPGGVLTTPGMIDQESAELLEKRWNAAYSGENIGRVAVLGNGLEYKPMGHNAHDSQLIQQLDWTAKNVCMAFHVSPYMIGAEPAPAYNNVEALNQQYYSQTLQNPIESIELLLDEGLGMSKDGAPQEFGVELELESLLRLDTTARMSAAEKGIRSGVTPNEIRNRYHDLPPIAGGNTVFLQHQDWPIEVLAQRDVADLKPEPSRALAADSTPGPESQPDAEPEERGVFAAAIRRKAEQRGLTRAA